MGISRKRELPAPCFCRSPPISLPFARPTSIFFNVLTHPSRICFFVFCHVALSFLSRRYREDSQSRCFGRQLNCATRLQVGTLCSWAVASSRCFGSSVYRKAGFFPSKPPANSSLASRAVAAKAFQTWRKPAVWSDEGQVRIQKFPRLGFVGLNLIGNRPFAAFSTRSGGILAPTVVNRASEGS